MPFYLQALAMLSSMYELLVRKLTQLNLVKDLLGKEESDSSLLYLANDSGEVCGKAIIEPRKEPVKLGLEIPLQFMVIK